MSEYSETLETSEDGRFRVRLVLDAYPDEPYDDGQSPLMRLDYSGYGWRAEHIMATGRPLDADSYVEAAAERWGTDFGLLEKYLRAYHGVTQMEAWHSGNYWYITYDPAAWRAHVGAPEGSANMSAYRAYCTGDVWGWVTEKLVRWTTDDGAVSAAFRDEWETVDSCWGYYGSDGANGEYLKQTARDELAYLDEPYAHMSTMHEIRADLLDKWNRETVTRKHAKYHEAAWAGTIGHVHDDPHAPFAVAALAGEQVTS